MRRSRPLSRLTGRQSARHSSVVRALQRLPSPLRFRQGVHSSAARPTSGAEVDVYSTIEAEYIEGPVPIHGLPSLAQQLRTAEANFAKLRGSDPTSFATKEYLKELIDKLKKDIYNSKSLVEQVDSLYDRVIRAEAFSQAAQAALKTAIEVKDSMQRAYDSATEVEEDLRHQLDDLRQCLEREEDAARAHALASPPRKVGEFLPDTADELITAIKDKGNKEFINQIFIQLATDAVNVYDLNIPQFAEHLQRAQTEFRARAAPQIPIPAAPAAPAAPVCPMETDEPVRTIPPVAGLAAVPQMPSFSPIKGTENFNISSEGEEMTSMKHLSARPSTRPVQADNSWRQPPPSQDPSEQDRISSKVSLLKNEKLFNADGKPLSVIEIQQVLVKTNEEVVKILRDSKGHPPLQEDVGILCGIYLFANANVTGASCSSAPATALQQGVVPGESPQLPLLQPAHGQGIQSEGDLRDQAPDPSDPSSVRQQPAEGSTCSGAPATVLPQGTAPGDSLQIPLLQPAHGQGIQSEGDLPDQARDLSDPASVRQQKAKAPFSRDQRVGIKDKGFSENDIKTSHNQRASQLSAATTSSRLDSLRAKGSPLSGAAADTYQELFPEATTAAQGPEHLASEEQPPLPSPRNGLQSEDPTTPSQVSTDEGQNFRVAPGTGTAT